MEVPSSLYKHFLVVIIAFLFIHGQAQPHDYTSDESFIFPPNFLFGTASSAYQYEGAYLTDGKGLSNWDVFTHQPGIVEDGSNGDVTIDFYHRYPEIIDLMVSSGSNSFQFSISWARILPKGRFGEVNGHGIDFYNKLIDTLLSKGIEPFVVLHHFDMPIELEKRYKTWLSSESVEDFKYYADICFKNFGDRVKYWVTFSEPNQMIITEYKNGWFPPARCSKPYGNCVEGDSEKEPLVAAHNLILAHAAAVKLYKTKYQKGQGGQIGIAIETIWFEPMTNSTTDKLTAERAQSFYSNWFLDPIVFGRYPKEMIDILGNDLPKFSRNDVEDLKFGVDFLGINHYISLYVQDCLNNTCKSSYGWLICNIDGNPIGEMTGCGAPFSVYPKGFQKTIEYVKERCNNIPMFIAENGYCETSDSSSTHEDSLNDVKRVNYLRDYLGALAEAIRGGADVRGYFLWTLLDAFEWRFGYNLRFGIHHLDFDTKKISPKSSASWYKQFIEKHNAIQVSVLEHNPQLQKE